VKPWLRTPLFYVAAFFTNAFFLVSSLWLFIQAEQGASEPGDSYYGIVELLPALLTIIPATLGAWILRRLARWFSCRRWWQWLLAGSAIGLAVVQGLGRLGLAVERASFPVSWQPLKAALMEALLTGPMTFTFRPWWLPVPALAAVALVLFLVQRAFGWQTASNKTGTEEARK